MSILVIRHAERKYSRNDTDPPLLNNDPMQLPLLADMYFDRQLIICSPYLRCRQTAQLLTTSKFIHGYCPHIKTELHYDLRLSEFQNGKPVNITDSTQDILDKIIAEQNLPAETKLPDDTETYPQFVARCNSFIAEVQQLRQRTGWQILVITHGAIVRYWSQVANGPVFASGRAVPFLGGFVT